MPKGGKRVGAGAKPRSRVKSKNHSIKFTDSEWDMIQHIASLHNITASEWVRLKALSE